ncbi:hypothetical protein Tco_1064989 [Tanacetum coccineum]
MSKRKLEHVMDAVYVRELEGKEGHPQRRAAAFCSCQSGTRMYCCSFVVHDTETERARSANAEGCKRNVLVEAYQRAKTTAATGGTDTPGNHKLLHPFRGRSCSDSNRGGSGESRVEPIKEEEEKLAKVVASTTPSPEWSENETLETTRKRMKWENDNYICRGHILNGMSDSLFDIYQNAESAKTLWESLESKYMAEDASATKFLVSSFMNYKMVDTRPVMEQYCNAPTRKGRSITNMV